MIVLDTHIWVWWVNDPSKLKPSTLEYLDNQLPSTLLISVISCWEVAKLVEKGRLELPESLPVWFEKAISKTGITVIEIEQEIIVDACSLSGTFHNDPADQLIVATSRVKNAPLLTADGKILIYEHVVCYDE